MSRTSQDEQSKSVWFSPTLRSLAVSLCCSRSLQYLSFGGFLWHPLILSKTESFKSLLWRYPLLKVVERAFGVPRMLSGCGWVLLYCLHSCSCHTPVRLDGALGAEQREWGEKKGLRILHRPKKSLNGVNALGGGVPGWWLLSDWWFSEE